MSDKEIGSLTSGGAAASGDIVHGVRSSNSRKLTLGALAGKDSAPPRSTSVTSSSTPTPNCDTTDVYIITALAADPTFGAPTGTPVDGQRLLFRIKDNGTARAFTWNSAYRAGTDIALPTSSVVSKTMYVGFMWNSADSKWDLAGVVGNI